MMEELVLCGLCGKKRARTLCESDQANLCWDCDATVHGANFLVAKHVRVLLCRLCHSPTPWKASGPSLPLSSSSLCHPCSHIIPNEDEDEEAEEEEEGENQVVPWSSSSTSSSSPDPHLNLNQHQRSPPHHHHNIIIPHHHSHHHVEDEIGCSSSSEEEFLFRPSKQPRRGIKLNNPPEPEAEAEAEG